MLNRLVCLLRICLSLLLPIQSYGGDAESPRLIRDTEIESILREFAEPLFRVAGLDPKRLRMLIVGSADVNAAASFGLIFINTGLITKSDTPEEVIGVIAHETGHIAGGHISQRFADMEKKSTLAMGAMALGLASMLAGLGPAGLALGLGTQSSMIGSAMHYSRGQEASADQKALILLDRLKWSSKGLWAFMKKLSRQELLSTDRQDGFFRTHPFSSERVQLLQRHVNESKFQDLTLPPEFYGKYQRIRTKIIAFMEKPMGVLMKYPASDTSFNNRYARCIAFYRLKDFPQSLALLEELIAESPKDPYLYDLKGQILFDKGDLPGAQRAYEIALSQCGQKAPLIQMAIAQCQIEQFTASEHLEKAIVILRKVAQNEDDNPMVWKLLATAYGKNNRIGQASLCLAEEAMCLEDYDRAVGLAKKALLQLQSGPEIVRAKDIVTEASRRQKGWLQ